ncbi:MAG TPA: hypothetical protein VHJ18_27440 [Streptosporangiaceae bacterium]|jgi:hypothetical protein|nr:hypothetical protein [Streptosporangiaceae bacterium]
MSTDLAKLGISLMSAQDADAEAVAEATRQLRREILELDVDSVDSPRTEAPPLGSRAVDVTALGALVVTIAQTPLLGEIVEAARSWLARSRQGTIKLELDGDVLELTGISSDEQRRLTDEWLRRHQGATG